MAAPGRTKTPMESRLVPFNMDALIASGASLTSVQAFASRTLPLRGTTLFADVAVGATTIELNADPKAGALLIIEPGSGSEETLKVVSVSGASVPFLATVTPPAWSTHSATGSVNYEDGVSARLLVDDTPTPSATSVTVQLQKGAHGQIYRISVVGTCNNGEVVEDEMQLTVTDVAPTETNIKQATETRDVAGNLALLLSEPHQSSATLSSATAFVSASGLTTTTQLSAQANAEDSNVLLVAHPGIGAKLILNPAGPNPEHVYVSNVTGTGPYTATVNPTLEFTHSSGVDVTVFQGVGVNFLTSTTSTIQALAVINRARHGAVGKTFKILWLATTSQGELLQLSGLVSVQEV
jgi:hypothetical protein